MDWLVPLLAGIGLVAIGLAFWEVRDWFWTRPRWMPMWLLRASMRFTPVFLVVWGFVLLGVGIYAATR